MIRKQPRFSSLQKGLPIVKNAHTILPFNERQGTKIWDHATRKNYNFDAAYPPSFEAEGISFTTERECIDWIAAALSMIRMCSPSK